MPKKSIATACLLFLSIGCSPLAGTALADDAHHTVVAGDAINWGPAPAWLPSGAQAAVLLGNPAKEGPLRAPPQVPRRLHGAAHRHAKDEFVTVIAGKFAVGAGRRWTGRPQSRCRRRASCICRPASRPYAWADGEAVVQIDGFGPFDVKYVDPKDDPRNRSPSPARAPLRGPPTRNGRVDRGRPLARHSLRQIGGWRRDGPPRRGHAAWPRRCPRRRVPCRRRCESRNRCPARARGVAHGRRDAFEAYRQPPPGARCSW